MTRKVCDRKGRSALPPASHERKSSIKMQYATKMKASPTSARLPSEAFLPPISTYLTAPMMEEARAPDDGVNATNMETPVFARLRRWEISGALYKIECALLASDLKLAGEPTKYIHPPAPVDRRRREFAPCLMPD